MHIGVMVPQGWLGEYPGWEPERAWSRTLQLALQAEELGFESVWVVDHLQTAPDVRDEITFESFTSLSALAGQTRHVKLGHAVLSTGWRNPALVAKMISTLDVISGGRAILGVGAGWKRDEWEAYGFGFPSTRERLGLLRDHLEVMRAMLAPGRARVSTPSITVADAVNEPPGLQRPGIPIMVGGNGPEVTWRLAARFADELNFDGLLPPAVRDALPVVASRCEEIGRDPASLAISAHIFASHVAEAGSARRALMADYADAGMSRVMMRLHASAVSDQALVDLADDARAAGCEMAPA